jgi:hypothetical protein
MEGVQKEMAMKLIKERFENNKDTEKLTRTPMAAILAIGAKRSIAVQKYLNGSENNLFVFVEFRHPQI